MNTKQILLALVLADFVAFTGYAVYLYGYLGFFETLLSSTAGQLVFVDLCIALTMVMAWMWYDARERGLNVVPYLVVTLFTGSAGPLLYLIRREATGPAPAPAAA